MYSGKKFGVTDFILSEESEDKSVSQVNPLLGSNVCLIQ